MITLTKEQFISKLVTLCEETDLPDIDAAIAQAKNELAKRNGFRKLFREQIATLEERGCPENILKILRRKEWEVVEKASKMTMRDGNTPFVPVIKLECLGYHGLMSMVRNDEKSGRPEGDELADISDDMETPRGLYYVYDVSMDDEKTCNGKSRNNPKDSPPNHADDDMSRSTLTMAEMIALATHDASVFSGNLWALSSRYNDYAFQMPFICLDENGQPIIRIGTRLSAWTITIGVHHSFSGYADNGKRNIYPSCGSRGES